MAVETLRPDTTLEEPAWVTVEPGTDDPHEVLSDDADGTYVTGSTASSTDTLRLDLESHSLPADAVVAAVRVRVRTGTDDGSGGDVRVRLLFALPSLNWAAGSVLVSGGDEVADHDGSWKAETPGGAWTQDDIDDLQVWVVHEQVEDFPVDVETAEVWVDVEYNEPPEVTLTAPSGTVTDTSRPTVEWDYDDEEDDPQEAFEVVVFDESDVPATPPDDPEEIDADPVYESGTRFSSATEHQIAEALTNDATYRVYVRARQQWSGPEVWSDWDHGTFTLDLATPAAPDVTLTPDPDNGRMLVVVEDGSGGEDPGWFRIEYRDGDGDGDNWKDLLGGDNKTRGHPVWFEAAASEGGTAADWWAPHNVERTYRVRGYRAVAGNQIAGPATVEAETLVSDVRRITDARDPDVVNTTVRLSDHGRAIQGREVVHRPAGMAVAIVESEPPTRQDTVTLHSLDADQHDALADALGSTRTLLYRDRRESVFFRWVGDRGRGQRGPDGSGVDDWTGTMVEVAQPLYSDGTPPPAGTF